MISKSVLKRTCAGILAFLMVSTSYPASANASVASSEDTIDAVTIEEEISELDIADSDRVEEETPTYSVEVGLENISTITYAFGEYVNGDIVVPYEDSRYPEKMHAYTIKDLDAELETPTPISVPQGKYLVIIDTVKVNSDYCDAIVKRGGYEQTKTDVKDSYIHYDDSKKTKISAYAFYIPEDITYDPETDTGAPIEDTITIKSKKIREISISLENIESFDYSIAENVDDVIESYGTKGSDSSATLTATIQNDKTSFSAQVPDGYSLNIWNIKEKYPETYSPYILKQGEYLYSEDDYKTITLRSGEEYDECFRFQYAGSAEDISNISLKSIKCCTVDIDLKDVSEFSYVILPEEAMRTKPCDVDSEDIETVTVDPEDEYYQIKKVPIGYYLVLFDLEGTDSENSCVVKENGLPLTIEGRLLAIDGEYDDVDLVSGYAFQIKDNKDDLAIQGNAINDVVIDVMNIKSITYVVAEDLNSVPESDITTIRIAPGADVDVNWSAEDADWEHVTIKVPDGYYLVVTNFERYTDEYLTPELSINGVKMERGLNIGTIIKTLGGTTRLDGYKIAKVDDPIPSGSIKIESKSRQYTVGVSGFKTEKLCYATAKTVAELEEIIKDALENPDDPEKRKELYMTEGFNKAANIPLGNYFAIYDVTPNKGCYGYPKVTNGDKVVNINSVEVGDDEYEYYLIGKVTSDISTVRADVIETAYDVVIFTQDVKELSYVVYGEGEKPVQANVETVAVETDEAAIEALWDGVSEKLPEGFTGPELPDDVNGFVLIEEVPVANYLVVTKLTKIDGGTALNNDTLYIDGKLIKYMNQPVKYTNGATFTGWSLGALNAPYPVYDYNKKEKQYHVVSNYAVAKSANYRFDLNLKSGPVVDIDYREGYWTWKSSTGLITYYTDVVWNEDKDDYETYDLVANIVSKSKDYDVSIYGPGQTYIQMADVYARAYKTDEYNVTTYSDPFEMIFDDETGYFTLSADQIYDWLGDTINLWESISIEVKPYLEISFPTQEDDQVEVYVYNSEFKSIAKYKESGILIEDFLREDYEGGFKDFDVDEYIADSRFGDSVAFVVVPTDEYNDDFVVDSVTEALGSKCFTKMPYNDGEDIQWYYQLVKIDRDMVVKSTIRTKTTNVNFTLINYTEKAPGGVVVDPDPKDTSDDPQPLVNNGTKYGKATFTSKNVTYLGPDGEGYKYTVSQNITDLEIVVKEAKQYARLRFFLNDEEVEPVSSNAKGEYTFKIPAYKLVDAEIKICNQWDTKDFYITYNPEQVNVTITSMNEVIEQADEDPQVYPIESLLKNGNMVFHYRLPNNETSIITVRAKDNCAVKNVLVKGVSKSLDYAGNYSHYVTGNNSDSGSDFIIATDALKTLYFGVAEYDEDGEPVLDGEGNVIYDYEPHTTNKYVTDADKNKLYSAYIRVGNTEKVKLPITDTVPSTVQYKATIGSKDYTNTIISVVDDVMYLNLTNEEVAGQKVTITVKDGGTTLATLTLNVTAYAKTATVKGEKSGVITQDLLSDKVYDVTFNKGVKSDDIVAVYQYMDPAGDWKTFTDDINKFTYNGEDYKFFDYDGEASKLTIRANALMDIEQASAGMPKMQVLFFDTTMPEYDEDKVIGIDNPDLKTCFASKFVMTPATTLAGNTPAVKLGSSTDLGINLQITAPKSYVSYYNSAFLTGDAEADPMKAGLYYVIKAVAVDGKRPEQMVHTRIMRVEATGLETTAFVKLAKDLEPELLPGEGAGWKYNVTVRAYYGVDPELVDVDYVFSPEYGISKIKTLKGLATKDPYHETKLGIAAKKNKIYQGEKNVNIAHAKFSKNTTFFNLKCVLKDEKGNIIKGVDEFYQGNPEYGIAELDDPELGKDPADIFIKNSSDLTPGNYILYVYPEPASAAATLPITIYESIQEDGFAIVAPSKEIYKKTGSAASAQMSVVYDADPETGKLPKTQKVIWSVKKADGASEDFDITKFVSINPTNGKITIDKSFKHQPNPYDNMFKVCAVAADYVSDPERKATPVILAINDGPAKINSLVLYNGDTKINPVNGKIRVYADEVTRLEINGTAKAVNCTTKSSSDKIVEIAGPTAGNDKSFNLTVNGIGSVKLTVTSQDGAKASATIAFEVIPRSGDEILELSLGGDSLDPDAPTLVSIDDVLDADGLITVSGGSDDLASDKKLNNYYTLKVSGGAKLNEYLDDMYLTVTGPTFKFTLIDKSKKRTDEGYQQVFEVGISEWATNENAKPVSERVTVSFNPTDLKPGLSSLLKLTGVKEPELKTYSVSLRPDTITKLKAAEDYFENYELSFEDDSIFSSSLNFEYDFSKRVMTPASEDAFALMSGDDCKAQNGKYKYNAYIYNDDGDLVSIKAVTLGVKDADKATFDLYDNYDVSAYSTAAAQLIPNETKCKNLLGNGAVTKDVSYKIVSIDDVSINGKIKYAATKYFELDDDKLVPIAAQSEFAKIVGESVYVNVKYYYWDMSGKCYEATKVVEISIRASL